MDIKKYNFRIQLCIIFGSLMLQSAVWGSKIGSLNERIKMIESNLIDDDRLAILETKIGFIEDNIGEIKDLLKDSFNK